MLIKWIFVYFLTIFSKCISIFETTLQTSLLCSEAQMDDDNKETPKIYLMISNE